MGIRIIIADDHKIVRQGLTSLIHKEPNMEVLAEAEDGRRAVTLVKELLPQVVVMDVKMPHLNGIEAARQILAEFPQVKIVALSMYADRQYVTNMLRTGIHGYLLKDCAFEELAQAIRSVMSNKKYFSSEVAEIAVNECIAAAPHSKQSVYDLLSDREREVLQLLAEGKKPKQIANFLCLSVKTVETHKMHIMQKTGMRNTPELVKYAIREGLTTLDD